MIILSKLPRLDDYSIIYLSLLAGGQGVDYYDQRNYSIHVLIVKLKKRMGSLLLIWFTFNSSLAK